MIELIQSDITKLEVDAIVNAANSTLQLSDAMLKASAIEAIRKA